MVEHQSRFNRILKMLVLITAGEVIFVLPFMLPRLFRTTYIDVFGLDNFEFGLIYAVFGIIALVAYFFGGILADFFPARKLIATALLLTGLGGLFLSTIPSIKLLTVIYGFWGITTMLLLWSALHKATREWGGIGQQGLAFGLLDGGRGLVSALVASLVVAIFAFLLPTAVAEASVEQRTQALSKLFQICSFFVIALTIPAWLAIKTTNKQDAKATKQKINKGHILRIARMPVVWLQGIIIFCAYTAFKTIDFFSIYATDVFAYNEVTAGQLMALLFWVRPFAAFGAGFLADSYKSSQIIIWSFLILIIGSILLISNIIPVGVFWLLAFTLAATCIGIYALRGVYFALFEEASIPINLTGTATGIISIVGFLPDLFISPLMGYLIDATPGVSGYQHLFGLLLLFSIIGLTATLFFRRYSSTRV